SLAQQVAYRAWTGSQTTDRSLLPVWVSHRGRRGPAGPSGTQITPNTAGGAVGGRPAGRGGTFGAPRVHAGGIAGGWSCSGGQVLANDGVTLRARRSRAKRWRPRSVYLLAVYLLAPELPFFPPDSLFR